MIPHPDPKPDTLEKVVRFVCGFLAGIVLGAFIWIQLWPEADEGWATLPVTAILFGLGATYLGDRFWLFFGRRRR